MVRNPFSTAREWDSETGLYYYRARYYDAGVGRFIGADPIGIKGGINFYTYVFNNPLNFIDPLGLEVVCVEVFHKTKLKTAYLGKEITKGPWYLEGSDIKEGFLVWEIYCYWARQVIITKWYQLYIAHRIREKCKDTCTGKEWTRDTKYSEPLGDPVSDVTEKIERKTKQKGLPWPVPAAAECLKMGPPPS